jgi:phosphoribosylaminoimidazolecarboxamide formyltransferase/IMP cyclohydrolase
VTWPCLCGGGPGADRHGRFGDFISLSCECDLSTAQSSRAESPTETVHPPHPTGKGTHGVLNKKKGGAYSHLAKSDEGL